MGTTDHLALNASLLPVAGGRPRAEAKVEGVADSLPQLVDRLIAQLITEEAGAPRGLAGLVNRPLPALRLYLEAQAAYRRANYPDAVARLSQALDLDSTFALAGLRLASAAGWTTAPGAGRRGTGASVGQSRPAEPARPGTAAGRSGSGLSGRLPAGEASGLVGARRGSRPRPAGAVVRAGRRVLPRGSLPADRVHPAAGGGGLPPVGGAGLGHRAAGTPARDRGARRTTARRCGAWAPCTWPATRAASCWASTAGASPRGCTTSRRWPRCARSIGRCALPSLWRIMNYAVLDGRRLEDAESAAVAIRATAGRSSDWQRSKTYLHAFEINRGHPAKALGDTARPDEDEYAPHTALYERVLDAMYGDGDSVNGSQAARELARLARASGLGRKRRASGRADGPVRRHSLAAEPWRARRRRSGHHASPVPRARRLARVAHHRHRLRRAARGEARGRLRRAPARRPRWIGWTPSCGAGPADSGTARRSRSP